MVYAGLAMLGLALAAIVMVLVTVQRDGGTHSHDDEPPAGSGPSGQPGSGAEPMPRRRAVTGRAISA